MPKFARDRNKVVTVDINPIQRVLASQMAKPAPEVASFDPQVHFIITNKYYEAAALFAMGKAKAVAANICRIGMGGWSLEIQYADRADARLVIDAYHASCDAKGLYLMGRTSNIRLGDEVYVDVGKSWDFWDNHRVTASNTIRYEVVPIEITPELCDIYSVVIDDDCRVASISADDSKISAVLSGVFGDFIIEGIINFMDDIDGPSTFVNRVNFSSIDDAMWFKIRTAGLLRDSEA